MNEPKPQSNSSCSEETVSSAQSDALLTLGRKIVDEMSLELNRDTLGRWMAHHIADLITKAAASTGPEKASLEKECFAAILALWEHRSELPDGSRPFEKLEPVIRAIEELDPENEIHRYYRDRRPSKDETPESAEQESWLRTADALDYSAKVLIGYCLTQAASAALDKSKEWVALAEAAGCDPGPPEFVIRFITRADQTGKERDLNDGMRELLADRLKRIRGIITVAQEYASHVDNALKALPAPREVEETEVLRMASTRPSFD